MCDIDELEHLPCTLELMCEIFHIVIVFMLSLYNLVFSCLSKQLEFF